MKGEILLKASCEGKWMTLHMDDNEKEEDPKDEQGEGCDITILAPLGPCSVPQICCHQIGNYASVLIETRQALILKFEFLRH